jgi:predicted methyltransferase
MHHPLRTAALALAFEAACNAGPTPKDASVASPVPIHNTAAVVENAQSVTEVPPSPLVIAVLEGPDRDARDVARYQTVDLLSFFDLWPGARVAELTAGGGYLTELLAREVGPAGLVFANEPPSLSGRTNAESAFKERLAKPVNSPVTASYGALAHPLPSEARDLEWDAIQTPNPTQLETQDRFLLEFNKP